MAINEFTLTNLYNQGILDYVPMDLCNSTNVSSLTGMQNPYLNMAKQGALYQNAGAASDTFAGGMTGGAAAGNIAGNMGAGLNNSGINYGAYNTTGNPAGYMQNSYAGGNNGGFSGVNNGINYGINSTFGSNNSVENLENGTDGNNNWAIEKNISNTFGKLGRDTASFVSSVPSFVKGLASGAIVLGTIALCLKGKKKPPVQEKQGFFSRLIPSKKTK